MKISVLVGNPKAESRTLQVALAVAERVGRDFEQVDTTVIDLATLSDGLFRWPHQEIDELVVQAAASDLLVVASPTYKASYTGLLKAFLDRYDTGGLAGTVAVPVMTAGSDLHSLASDLHLRPLLVELAASVPTSSLVLTMNKFADLESVVDSWFAANAAVLLPILQARA